MGKGHKQTTTNSLDKPTTAMQGSVYDQARKAAAGYTTVGPDGATTDALDQYRKTAAAGQNGLAALSGDPTAMAGFMNPYQSQVMDAFNSQYADARKGVSGQINDEATQAGAFGGSRHGVAEGVAQSQLAKDHMGDVAGLLQSGYNNAQNVAGQVANLGFGATGQMAGIGDYLRQISQMQANPGQQQLGILKQGLDGTPYGTSTTQYEKSSPLSTITGIASLGMGLFGGPGAAAAAAGAGGGAGSVAAAAPYLSSDPHLNWGGSLWGARS
jgi:hypothetical protein